MRCKCCGLEKSIGEFPNGKTYTQTNGEVRRYKRKTCRQCFAGTQRNIGRERKRDAFNRLVGWPAMVLTIIVGIYQYDTLSGSNRTCFYSSAYGIHAVTINSMRMCPITWEFEI